MGNCKLDRKGCWLENTNMNGIDSCLQITILMAEMKFYNDSSKQPKTLM